MTAAWIAEAEAHRARGDLARAGHCCQQAIASDPRDAEAHYLLGEICLAGGELDEAIASFDEALRLAPQHATALNSLGAAWGRRGDLDRAVDHFRRAMALEPALVDAHYNLAVAAILQNRLGEAIDSLRRTLALRPDHAEALHRLAMLLAKRGETAEAAECWRRAVQFQPDFPDAIYNLGVALLKLGQYDEAIDCWRRALALRPDHAASSASLAALLGRQDHTDEARECCQAAESFSSHPEVWRLSALTLCPVVFESHSRLVDYRQRLRADIAAFDRTELGENFPAAANSGCAPSFQWQFDDCNQRPLREAYSHLFRRCFPVETPPGSGGRPRIGLVVTGGQEALFPRSLGGVLERFDRDRFELVVIGSDPGIGALRAAIRDPALRMISIPNQLEAYALALREARLDLIYYWEIGTDAVNYFLPFYRLAPVQCTSWGIQVTSGIPQVDYYLSSALAEPVDAAEHYSERLVLADTLLTCQPRVARPERPKPRAAFGLTAQDHVYLCAQQIGKFHPDFDPLLAGILRRDPRGLVVITADRHSAWPAQLLNRRFVAAMPDVADRIKFLPFQHGDDYRSLVLLADVLLDPPHFGGVNSTYDGLSFDKPIVTLPSRFQRGRYTLACYRKMGVLDCVASDGDHYVDSAVSLGTNAAVRGAASEKIRRASPALFDDVGAVREHERIFAELIERHLEPSPLPGEGG